MEKTETDICIIGAGPAGIFASIFAAKAGAKVILIEKNSSLLRKLLLTGGGRCNFTHTGDIDGFVRAYGKKGRFLKPSLHSFSNLDLIDYFEKKKIHHKAEKDGCIFPKSNRAADIVNALKNDLANTSAQILYGRAVKNITYSREKFYIETDKHKIISPKLIIATGGASWPKTGSTGDGYKFAQALGHTINKPKAALGPLMIKENWLGRLNGVSLRDVTIKCKVQKTKINTNGAIVFTQNGIGGPAAMDLSRHITDYLPNDKNPISIRIDLLGNYSIDRLNKVIIKACSKKSAGYISSILADFLPKSLAMCLCQRAKVSNMQANQLNRNMRNKLIRMIKEMDISVVSVCPIEQATITKGGICISEINSKTMESKIVQGLYFAGEVIDIDGPCGGYNLQIAFSTGYLAAISAAKNL